MNEDIVLQPLRDFCLSLPETSETNAWGHPNFRAGKRTFAVFEYYESRPCIAFKATDEDRAVLALDERFFATPYIGRYGWYSMWVDRVVDWDQVRNLVIKSYRLAALKRMLKVLDHDC